MERKIHGKNACLAQFKAEPTSVVRVYLRKDLLGPLSALVSHCVQNKLAYHVVEDAEIAKISESEHHEGICIVARLSSAIPLERYLEEMGEGLILGIQDIKNPHNIGAILRTAAHYGVRAVVVPSYEIASSGAAFRTAEGGRSAVKVLTSPSTDATVAYCKAVGLSVLATSGHKGESVYGLKWPKRGLLLFGEERRGLSKDIMAQANHIITLPGSGSVESLNVSCACAVTLSEFWRGRGGGK